MPNDPNGWKGVIEHGSGNTEIHPWETIEFENAGIYIYHHDKYETTTFLPVFTVRSVRWHDAAKEKDGPNVSGRNLLMEQERYHERMQQLSAERKAIGEHEEESE